MGLILGSYRGLPIVEHNGALFGYRADILRFPDQKFTVACLCNVSNANPEVRARKVADLYLKADMQSDTISGWASDRRLPDPTAFAGEYIDPRTHTIYSFAAVEGDLQGWGAALRRKSANQFYDLFGDVITFEASDGSMKATLDMNGEMYFAGQTVNRLHLSEAAAEAFAGDYRSRELDGAIHLSLQDGGLMLKDGGNPLVKLSPIAADEFVADGNFAIVFHRDQHGKVSGLSVFAPAARGIEFIRTE
jgi:hypothetical protein